tara:strand:- start:1494 stop:1814 length:321 start_codon:yes stop_codon:yes gene_type:complete
MPDVQLRNVLERLGWKSRGASVHMLDLEDIAMGFLAGIFGGGGDEEKFVAEPIEEAEEQRTDIDPNLDAELSEAKKQRQAVVARRGRSELVTSRKTATKSGVNIVS